MMLIDTTPPRPERPRSLRSDLEARRLQHRTRRLEFVLQALKERARGYQERGSVPRPLHDAIHGFTTELRRDRERLRELGRFR
ncbi:MAG TPA: hypothetical protein VFT50_13770 [Baekduia sp.]|nr:hypothetical protein [Baekduia sp.]